VRVSRRVSTIVALILCWSMSSAFSEEADAVRRLETDGKGDAILAICPAVLPSGRLSNGASRLVAACDGSLESCIVSCLDRSDAASCFQAALTLQQRSGANDTRNSEIAFALGCAANNPASCTNRASGILRELAAEAFPDAASRTRCTFDTFSHTCDSEDSWGCTMLGVAYHFGEGVQVDAKAARRAYHRACALAPEFEACSYARAAQKKLDGG